MVKNDILDTAKEKQLNLYKEFFSPNDLGLNANKYGSFSDHCSNGETRSSKWNKNEILKAVEFTKSGKPKKYLLI